MENCYSRALRLLARVEHSRKGLEQKLLVRGYEPEQVRTTLDRLETLGALNDERFAEEWVRSRLRKHTEGKGLLLIGLGRRGVAEEVAQRVVNASREWVEYQDALKRAYDNLKGRGINVSQEIARALRKKGFTSYEIRRLFEELC